MHYTYVCYLCMIVCMLLPIACVPDIVCDVCEKVKSHHAGYYGTQSGRYHQLMMYVPLLLQTFYSVMTLLLPFLVSLTNNDLVTATNASHLQHHEVTV